jgi:hypothetical protein
MRITSKMVPKEAHPLPPRSPVFQQEIYPLLHRRWMKKSHFLWMSKGVIALNKK